MFKFNFDLEDAEDEPVESSQYDIEVNSAEETQEIRRAHLVALTVEELIESLPPLISYSPLHIPLRGDRSLTLMRRDLFDARFQLISESSTAETSNDLEFIDAPSDLVPGVYEGGLKTWECSSDLVAHLQDTNVMLANGPCRLIEIGCGTAVPALYLLGQLFSADPAHDSNTAAARITMHLQDYNSVVLQLITLPNIILTWYASRASGSYRGSHCPPLHLDSEPGELQLTPELLSAFRVSLQERRIDLTFFGGSWIDMEAYIRETQIAYDLVLTSETIYQSTSLPTLVRLLRSASTLHRTRQKHGNIMPPSHRLAQLSLRDDSPREPASQLCLVAAKVLYFGVGGGIDEFERAVKAAGGRSETVLERKVGVGRRIIKVDWGSS